MAKIEAARESQTLMLLASLDQKLNPVFGFDFKLLEEQCRLTMLPSIAILFFRAISKALLL
jgi:hypothetical protein